MSLALAANRRIIAAPLDLPKDILRCVVAGHNVSYLVYHQSRVVGGFLIILLPRWAASGLDYMTWAMPETRLGKRPNGILRRRA